MLANEQEEAPQVGRHEELRVGMVDDLTRLDRLPGVDCHVEIGAGRQITTFTIRIIQNIYAEIQRSPL